jgi:hypothetical protein
LADNQTSIGLSNYLKSQTDFPEVTWCRFQNFIKIYFKFNPRAGSKQWTFPFIDVFFYNASKTNGKFCLSHRCANLSETFPLKLRPFGKFWLPTPKNIQHYLKNLLIRRPSHLDFVDVDKICVKAGADHKNEIKLKVNQEFECDLLKDSYPFVNKNCNQTHCVEKLKLNQTTLNTFVYEI